MREGLLISDVTITYPTPREKALLRHMIDKARRVSPEEIYDCLWPDVDATPLTFQHTVSVYICRIRRKLNHKFFIQSYWGQGYELKEKAPN